MHQTFEKWLNDEYRADRWYTNTNPFTATERRVLITHWGGTACIELCPSPYDALRWKNFNNTECLITSDGSDDHLIKPEGLPDYAVPLPFLFIQPSSSNPRTIDVDPHEMPANEEMVEPELSDVDGAGLDDNEGGGGGGGVENIE